MAIQAARSAGRRVHYSGAAEVPTAKAKKSTARKAKVPAVRQRPGVPSTYTPELGTELCTRIAMGETLRGICHQPSAQEVLDREAQGLPAIVNEYPTEYTVRKWLGLFPDFHKLYHNARTQQADAIFDLVVDMGVGLVVEARREPGKIYRDREVATAARVLQWAAGKLKPAEYGERSMVDPGVAIHIETTLDMGSGTEPIAGGKTVYTVEAAPLESAAQQIERVAKESKDGKTTKPKPAAGRK